MKKLGSFLLVCLIALIATSGATAFAQERKKESWGAACPTVIDTTPALPVPQTMNLLFTGNGQDYKLLETDGLEVVREFKPAIGCYVNLQNIEGNQNSPQWQIGALNRDNSGFYFINAAGIIWRLTLNQTNTYFLTAPGSAYYENGNQYKLTKIQDTPTNCKVTDYFMGDIRIAFPRNENRVPSKGRTKNLIIVVDFPDAPFTGDSKTQVKNVLSPESVQNYWKTSSNGELDVTFEIFPRVVRLNSLESSFKPNSAGGFYVNGAMQDHRLVREAIIRSGIQDEYADFASVSIFAPTANSLGYYGSAFLQFHLAVGSKYIENVFLVNGGIGTIQSQPPSWTVVAHEYGHLLGMYDYYISGNGNTGKSPGPFDFMGNTSGTAYTSLGYQRWVQGWLSDQEVQCDVENSGVQTFELAPLNSLSGKRLYTRALSGTKVLAGEYRAEGNYEKLNNEDGVLLYIIDTEIQSGKGPVAIQISPLDVPMSYSNDVEKYRKATLKAGEHLEVGSTTYFVTEVNSARAILKVFPSALYQEFLSSQKTVTPPSPKPSSSPIIKPIPTPIASGPKSPTKVITCQKGKNVAKITGSNSKCPSGWKRK